MQSWRKYGVGQFASTDHGAFIRTPDLEQWRNTTLVVSRALLLLRPRASAMRMPVGRCIRHRRGVGQARSRGAS